MGDPGRRMTVPQCNEAMQGHAGGRGHEISISLYRTHSREGYEKDRPIVLTVSGSWTMWTIE